MSDSLLVKIDGPVAEVTLNRPEAFNAVDKELLRALAEHLAQLAVDTQVRGVLITGAGKAFCAGGDLKSVLSAGSSAGIYAMLHTLAGVFHQAITEMQRMPKPVVAAINGVAAGGGFSLALAADFRVIGASAKMKCAYMSAGLTLDGGGSFNLTRIVGTAKALEIAAFDEPITAQQALALGLVTAVVPDDDVVPEARRRLLELSQRSMHAYGWAKRLILDAHQTPLEAQLELERTGIATCGAHPDGMEGLKAFTEKRTPKFVY